MRTFGLVTEESRASVMPDRLDMECLHDVGAAELAQRAIANLPHALARDVQAAADLLERLRLAPVEAKVRADDLCFARPQRLGGGAKHVGELLVGERRIRCTALVLEHVGESAVRIVGERRVEGSGKAYHGQRA